MIASKNPWADFRKHVAAALYACGHAGLGDCVGNLDLENESIVALHLAYEDVMGDPDNHDLAKVDDWGFLVDPLVEASEHVWSRRKSADERFDMARGVAAYLEAEARAAKSDNVQAARASASKAAEQLGAAVHEDAIGDHRGALRSAEAAVRDLREALRLAQLAVAALAEKGGRS